MANKTYTTEELDKMDLEDQLSKETYTTEELDMLEQGDKYPWYESLGAGAQDAALFGYGPNALSAIKNKSISSPEYISERDRLNREVEAMKEEDPATFMGGQALGIGATAIIPVGAAAEGAGLAARLGRAAIAGGVSAGLADTPDIEGQATSPLDKNDLSQRGKQAALGAAMGPIAEGAVTTINALTPERVERAFMALQPAKAARREARLSAEKGTLGSKDDIVNFAKSEGILDGFPDEQKLYERTLAAKDKYGDALDTIYRKAQQVSDDLVHSDGKKIPVMDYVIKQKDLPSLKNDIIKKIKKEDWASADKESAIKEISAYFDDLPSDISSSPDLMQLHEIKSQIGQKSYRVSRANLPNSSEEFWRKAGRMVDDEIKKRIDGLQDMAIKSGDKKLGESLREANKRYSLSSRLYDITTDAVDSQQGRMADEIGDISRVLIRSPKTQNALSKVGGVIDLIPDVLKPSGSQISQGIGPIFSPIALPPTPQQLEQQIRADKNLTPTEKARQINQIRKGM